MSGIYYLLSMIAIFVVIRWFIINDKVEAGEPTNGLLAMRDSNQKAPNVEDRNQPARPRQTHSYRNLNGP
jgi:hypothetical protein